jgi:outer membrane protein OmpA-like peptidoglycan-associated protein
MFVTDWRDRPIALQNTSGVCLQTRRRLTLITCLLTIAVTICVNLGAQAQITSDLPLSITILYFDQSSHQLRPNVKTMLDSIAQQLVKQPTLVATITGYTDNVGKRELNMALAEHRAKAVEQYLKQHGVLANQIAASWEGPDTRASTDGPKAVKTISRRVVVQLSPR